METIAILAAATLAVYALALGALVLAGKRLEAQALARLLPDLIVLVARLLRDPAVPRRWKVALAAVAAYLAFPLDLVPDFVPIAGQLDDLIVVALVLRGLLRAAGPDLLERHWPGPPASLRLLA